MDTRTVQLRLVVRSRDFGRRQAALDTAVRAALSWASAALLDHSFVVTDEGSEIIDEGLLAGEKEALRQSRPDDTT